MKKRSVGSQSEQYALSSRSSLSIIMGFFLNIITELRNKFLI